jgi:hypothetical protein
VSGGRRGADPLRIFQDACQPLAEAVHVGAVSAEAVAAAVGGFLLAAGVSPAVVEAEHRAIAAMLARARNRDRLKAS